MDMDLHSQKCSSHNIIMTLYTKCLCSQGGAISTIIVTSSIKGINSTFPLINLITEAWTANSQP